MDAMRTWFKTLLGAPGIHYFATRFGGVRLRAASFDGRFARVDWNFELDRALELVHVVEQYAQGGQILMLGCGSASLASALAPTSFAGFLGVDISPEAIRRASHRANEKIRFAVADCTAFQCERKYDLILFSESLYYINPISRKALLTRLTASLPPLGNIVVTIADPRRYAGILNMIRDHFTVVEDRAFQGGNRHLIVFH